MTTQFIHGKVSLPLASMLHSYSCHLATYSAGDVVMYESDLPFHKVMNLVGIIRNADNFGL